MPETEREFPDRRHVADEMACLLVVGDDDRDEPDDLGPGEDWSERLASDAEFEQLVIFVTGKRTVRPELRPCALDRSIQHVSGADRWQAVTRPEREGVVARDRQHNESAIDRFENGGHVDKRQVDKGGRNALGRRLGGCLRPKRSERADDRELRRARLDLSFACVAKVADRLSGIHGVVGETHQDQHDDADEDRIPEHGSRKASRSRVGRSASRPGRGSPPPQRRPRR